jgi:hypothetical protein
MDDLSSKERLPINAVAESEAGFEECTRKTPTEQQNLNSGQLENGESIPKRQARPPILATDAEPATRLFSTGEAGSLRSRWESIQVGFVDEPKRSVKEADELVGEVIGHLTEGFATERQRLASQWDRSDDVSTEDLRCSFRRYRSIFERLLAT